ncbi:hypothetical protein MK805_06495 [Shimazuella sp. AN120528]|uniref:hypothetical protein n=1 Tax=Shimazuella soli TaxID=1892854 RepID=UPI001F118B8A|nr:hypothetical protein [Shimazuella soli]MCH5584617.1 hypothetical protein [Shimazuella soli]
MKQETGKISNPLLPSILPDEVVQLTVAGTGKKVKGFWEFMNHCPYYQVDSDLHKVFDTRDHKEKMHIVMQLTETADHAASQDRTMSKVQIRSQNGQDIMFTLLDAKIIEMLDGIVYIHGANFDIFACPTYTGQKDREVVEIEEINTISEQ